MPVYPRPKGIATKVAYKILGVPANIKYKPSEHEIKLREKLLALDTRRMK